jgi:ABC-type transport system substrate-binding protein
VDWGTIIVAGRTPPGAAVSHGDDGLNSSVPVSDPAYLYRYFNSGAFPPAGSNWSNYKNPKVDELMQRAFADFDPTERDKLLAEAHSLIVDDAVWAFVVHDLDPRAMSAKVKGFVPVQSWYQDFTQVTVQ